MRLSGAKRVVLFNYDPETEVIHWRHYLVSVRPTGVSKAAKKLLRNSKTSLLKGGQMPDLSNFDDISGYFLK